MRFYPIDHPKFNTLSFPEQVNVVSLYTFRPDDYADWCIRGGFRPSHLPASLKKIDEALAILGHLRSEGLPAPDPHFPFQFHMRWSAFRCNYHHRTWENFDHRALGVDHHWVVNVRLFNLPVLVMEERASALWTWIQANHHSLSCTDCLKLTVLMLINVDRDDLPTNHLSPVKGNKSQSGGFREVQKHRQEILEDRYQQSKSVLGEVVTLEDLQGLAPIILDDESGSGARAIHPTPSHLSLDGYHASRKLLIIDQPRVANGHIYFPLMPEFFYLRARSFRVADWDLLR